MTPSRGVRLPFAVTDPGSDRARMASAIVRAASPYDSRSVLITRWYRSGSSISAA